ncbi:MAG: aminotransferase class III-fold pyridoxal phosphate-dependent enzyme [Bacillota bacterium]|nr:aminotransferase class III-fold pyridoxal phosphate-dependent enzyme [Bacillota bacterium]
MSNDFLSKHDITYNIGINEKVTRAKGMKIFTEGGKTYHNFNEITVLLGYDNIDFTNRIKKVLDTGIYSPVKGYDELKENLYKKLIKLTDKNFNKIFLSTSGSESIEWAVRIARNYTGRDTVVAFKGSLHGRTYMAATLSGIDRRKKGLGIEAPEIIHANYPNCKRCFKGLEFDNCDYECINNIDEVLDLNNKNEVAAVIIEPFTGSTGIAFPPNGYLEKLKKWTRKKGAVLIFDEIQTAIGKTGKMFGYEDSGVIPDILVLGKGLGNGMHISALMTNQELIKNMDGRIMAGGTGSNPICTEAANAVLDIIVDEGLLEKTKVIEEFMTNNLERLKDKYGKIDNFRGEGIVYGIEFVYDSKDRKPNELIVKTIVSDSLKEGIILGSYKNVLFFRPPLCVSLEEAELFIKTIEKILTSV